MSSPTTSSKGLLSVAAPVSSLRGLWRSATLAERVAWLRGPGRTSGAQWLEPSVDVLGSPGAEGRQSRALSHWLEARAFREQEVRDALRVPKGPGLVASDFVSLLGGWAVTLEQVLEANNRSGPTHGFRLKDTMRPFASWAMNRIEDAVRTRDLIGDDVLTQLCEAHLDALCGNALRVLALELNIARLRGALHGGTAEERQRSFVENLLTPAGFRRLCVGYPGLARLLAIQSQRWVEYVVGVFDALVNDLPRIRQELFDSRDCGRVERVHANLSDSHDGGRSVMILTFASGDRVVWKPRSLEVDVTFQSLLRTLNATTGLELPTLRFVPGADYGWVECVDHAALESECDAERFFRTHGAYLVVLRLLQATDFHSENVIARGSNPYLIDLEAAFHNDLIGQRRRDPGPAERALSRSVLRTGLLPAWAFGRGGKPGVDISGLSGDPSGQHGLEALILDSPLSDEAALRVRQVPVAERNNRARLVDGRPANLWEHVRELKDGLEHAYRALAADKELARRLIRGFRDCEVRFVPRATRHYVDTFRLSMHPDYARDTAHRELLLVGRLWRTGDPPAQNELMLSEISAMLWGDVPRFVTTPGDTSVREASSRRRVVAFERPAVQEALEALEEWGVEDLDRQLDLVGLSVASLGYGRAEESTASEPAIPVDARQEVERVVDELCRTAVRADGLCGWFGLRAADTVPVQVGLSALGSDVYEGVSGIGIFLAYAGRELQSEIAREAALGAYAHVLGDVTRSESIGWGGGFGGAASLWYALLHMGAALDSEEWKNRLPAGDAWVRGLEKDDIFDVIGGAAGRIRVFLHLYSALKESSILDAAVRNGEHLLRTAVRQPRGIAWPFRGATPLTGFAHGAAGIGWALLHLAAATNDPRFEKAGRETFEYERGLYSATESNWPDFRDESIRGAGSSGYAMAWCHGAPGIGMARATLPTGLRGELEIAEIEAAAEAIIRSGANASDCICHGRCGNLEILRDLGNALAHPEWREQADAEFQRRLAILARIDWRSGLPIPAPSRALMVGTAGIGLSMLRWISPAVPSVLALEGP